jgi:nicotinamide-nucleotide adenylyltransferase
MMTAFGREMRVWPESRDVSFDVGVTTEPYFHDKAEAIRSSGFYGNEEQPEQVFLAGFDTLIRIFNPKYYTEGGGMQAALGPFFETSRLRVTLRADDEWGSAEEQRAWVKTLEEEGEEGIEARGGNRAWLEKIELVDGVEGEAVSSSRVREAVSMGSEVAGMVGEEVKNWIDQEGLYREK